jgi:hypothetical protein
MDSITNFELNIDLCIIEDMALLGFARLAWESYFAKINCEHTGKAVKIIRNWVVRKVTRSLQRNWLSTLECE